MVGVALDRFARYRNGRWRVSDRIICHVIVRGRVQGVGYRAFVEDEAQRRGLQGWVRNCRDSSVEAVFAGPQAEVQSMIEACRRGPFSARVSALDQREGTDADLAVCSGGEMFSVLPTA
jgi:acylphosphatase